MAGEVGDIFSISNSFDLSEIQRTQKAQMRLAEFRERGDTLEHRTGVRPQGFFEYERKHPTQRMQNPLWKWIDAAIGGAIAVSIKKSWPSVAIGSSVGFVIGWILGPENESVRLIRALDHYGDHLTQLEIAADKIPSIAQPTPAYHQSHVAQLEAARTEPTVLSQRAV